MKIKRSFSDKFSLIKTVKTKPHKLDCVCYGDENTIDLCIVQGNDIFYGTDGVQKIKEFLLHHKRNIILSKAPIVFYENYSINSVHILNFLKENELSDLIEFSYFADDISFYGKI